MTQTHGSKYAPGYDLFKLIVAILLAVTLLFLVLHGRQQGLAHTELTVIPPTANETFTVVPLTATVTVTESAAMPTFKLEPPTLVPATETIVPSPTEIPTESATLIPAQTATSTPFADVVACPSAPSRIKIGDSIRVLSRLNFREGPGLNWPIILTNNPTTELLVIGGPTCTLRNTAGGPRAYLWWNVRMKDGLEGWSAEASLINPNYFLDPSP